jgi:hypothetical protein
MIVAIPLEKTPTMKAQQNRRIVRRYFKKPRRGYFGGFGVVGAPEGDGVELVGRALVMLRPPDAEVGIPPRPCRKAASPRRIRHGSAPWQVRCQPVGDWLRGLWVSM